MNTQPPSAAAGEPFDDAERIVVALPLVKRGADRDWHVQVALVHATLAVAAGVLGEWENREEHPTRTSPRAASTQRRPAPDSRAGRSRCTGPWSGFAAGSGPRRTVCRRRMSSASGNRCGLYAVPAFGKLLCRLTFHRWTERQNPDGEPYVACSRCGRVRESPPFGELSGPGPF